ncbi:hypothetical protein ACFL1J_02825, partial [Pseudomonadota bacterium]
VHESTKSKFNTTRESSLGGIKKKPVQKGEAFSFDAWQFRTGCTHIAERMDARERSARSGRTKRS